MTLGEREVGGIILGLATLTNSACILYVSRTHPVDLGFLAVIAIMAAVTLAWIRPKRRKEDHG